MSAPIVTRWREQCAAELRQRPLTAPGEARRAWHRIGAALEHGDFSGARYRLDALKRSKPAPLVAVPLGSDARCCVCGWPIEGEGRALEHGLAHTACSDGDGSHAGRGGQ
jgi:hypothetical protein